MAHKANNTHDISFIHPTSGEEIGLMLVRDKNGKPFYKCVDDPYLPSQFTTGEPGYGNLAPEKEWAIVGYDWRHGFGQEYYSDEYDKAYWASYGADLRFKGMGIAGPKATAVSLPSGISSAATLQNTDFEADANWTNGARSDTQAHGGTYSWVVTSSTDAYQDAATWDNSWQGKEFVFYCWVYAAAVGRAKIGINDGVGTTYSSKNTTATTWELLCVRRTLDASATRLRALLSNDYGSGNQYFDDCALGSPVKDVPKAFAEFNNLLFTTSGGMLCALNPTGAGLTFIATATDIINALEAFVDDNLYIASDKDHQYSYLDNGTVIENCEDAWDELVDGDVTSTADTSDYKVGSASAKLVVGDACGAGDILATEAISSTNLSSKLYIQFWLKSSVALDAGDLQILLDDTAQCASPIKSLDIPALDADTWSPVIIALGDPSGLTAIISIGLKMVTDKGAFTVRIDDVRCGAITVSTLSTGQADFFKTVDITLWKGCKPRELKSATDPTNAGSWSAATDVGSTAYDITELVEQAGSIYVMKEDMPYYLDSDGNVHALIPELKALTASTSGKNSVSWKSCLYIPCGEQSLFEYDDGTVTELSPATFCTNLSDFNGRIQALYYDEQYLFAVLDNDTKVELLAGRWETVGGDTDWRWHPIAELTLTGAETCYVSSIYKKRLRIASTSSSDDLYCHPLTTKYGDITGDTDYEFDSNGYFITPWLHANFKADDKAFIKLLLTLEDTTANVYVEAHYRILGETSWTDIGDFKTSPTTEKFLPVYDSTNPVGKMIQLKFVFKTNDNSLTPKLLGYDLRAILYPPKRRIIQCVVQCKDNAPIRKGESDQVAADIKDALEDADDATWPITFYDPWGDTYTVKFNDMQCQLAEDEKGREKEEHIYLELQRVTLS